MGLEETPTSRLDLRFDEIAAPASQKSYWVSVSPSASVSVNWLVAVKVCPLIVMVLLATRFAAGSTIAVTPVVQAPYCSQSLARIKMVSMLVPAR
jgi:hypothetical protein